MNTAKYLSYAEAWRRIKDATSQGFYFEVVTLCESIISDRLLSYVRGADSTNKATVLTPFSTLIAQWRKLASGKLPVHGNSDLGAAVDAWRLERNAIIHGLTKSEPGTPTAQVQPFIARAEQAAKTGAALARAVSSWHRRQLRAHRAVKKRLTLRSSGTAQKRAAP
ncbi:MAG: hypothetical protein EPO42_06820 [Gallionellaceae bacterium]|nr:MAG: hypothetical protein EPO42_06820 [Gallionellaceae bacterium]